MEDVNGHNARLLWLFASDAKQDSREVKVTTIHPNGVVSERTVKVGL